VNLKHLTVLGLAWFLGGCGERLGESDGNDGENVLDAEGGTDEPPDWMLGTFSISGYIGCGPPSLFVKRYVVYSGGRFDITDAFTTTHYYSYVALWEQREPGRYRVMRDESFADEPGYPIDPGFELEVIRSEECVPDNLGGGRGTFYHRIYRMNLLTGERVPAGSMRPGALCVDWEEEGCVDKKVFPCEEVPLPPSCDYDPARGSSSGD
jgi:hypothetical protein